MQGAVITVDEAREKMGFGPWPNPEEGKLSIAEFMSKHQSVIADGADAEKGEPTQESSE